VLVREFEQAAVADGDSVRVAREISQDLLRTCERALGENYPSDRKAQERRMNMQF
jgi:hypothetical protein